MSRPWLKLVWIAVFAAAWMQIARFEPAREKDVFAIDPPTPYVRYLPSSAPRGRVLLVHGLDVSKEVLWLVSTALADGGFETYVIDLPGHGDSPAGFDTALAQQAIRNVRTRVGEDAVVIGHSLGAGLLMDLAEDEQFSKMVLLSPPPLSVGKILADRVLIATGEQDLPRIRQFLPIATDIGGTNVEAWVLPWAGHSAPIRSPVYIRRVVDWVGGDGSQTHTLARIVWICVMFAAGVALGVSLMPGRPLKPAEVRIPPLLVRYVAAACVALVVLRFVNPFVWLRFFATDYLIGFVFVAGLTLIGTHGKWGQSPITPFFGVQKWGNRALTPFSAAAFVIIVLGFGVASNLLHMSLSNDRWWRFPIIALASFPLFAFDELTIRRIPEWWKSLGLALITRILWLAFLLIGVLILNRENAFLVLILPLIVLFWIALWFAAGTVHRHTQNAFGAALFSSLVQGWAFAAWFVTI